MHWALSKRIQIVVAFSAITLVAIFLLLPADTDVQTTKTSPIHDAIPQFDSNATINDANNILAIEMYKRIEPNQNKNIFFSPLGILTVFAMIYEGADGNTASQLESVFGFSKDDSHRWTSYYDLTKSFNDNSEDYDISLVNAVWLLNKFQPFPEYVDTLSKYYLAVSDTISDPQLGAKRINSWAHENTNGKISNIISEDTLADPYLKMILTNAVYFKGLWEEPFEKLSTKDRDFWTSSTKSITVPTMHKTDTYNYVQNDDAQILEIPYKGERFSMLIALPLQRDGIEDLENTLKSDTFVNWRKSMNATPVKVYMPKFEINTMYSDVLKNTLKDLGVKDSFAPGANFSKLSNDPLHISKLVQKAYVKADEKGTEAAAVTMRRCLLLESQRGIVPSAIFDANHPFIFVIWDYETENIIFMGRIFK